MWNLPDKFKLFTSTLKSDFLQQNQEMAEVGFLRSGSIALF